MWHTKNVVIALIIFAASTLTAYLIPANEWLRFLYATPSVGVLFVVLWQLLRDFTAHERAKDLQNRSSHFVLGTSSHMANVAFDRHVEFAELYAEEAMKSLECLKLKGIHTDVLNHADQLGQIHQKYALWVTNDMASQLNPFEQALRKIGGGAGFLKATQDEPGYEASRAEAFKILFSLWEDVSVERAWEGDTPISEKAILTLMQNLRRVLGIEELAKIRSVLVTEATRQLGFRESHL